MEKYIRLYGKELFDEELKLEDYYRELAQDSLQTTIDKAVANSQVESTQVGKKLVSYGLEDARKAVEIWYEDLKKPKRGVKPTYSIIILDMLKIFQKSCKSLDDPQEEALQKAERESELIDLITYITLATIINTIGRPDGIPCNNVAHIVAKELQEELKVEAFINTLPKHTLKGLLEGIKTRGDKHYKTYYARQAMVKQGFEWSKWNKKDMLILARQLIQLVVEGSGYFEIVLPHTEKGDGQDIIQPTDWLLKAWTSNTDKLLNRVFHNCPMVIPPLPWTSLKNGGYYGALHGRHTLLRSESLRGSDQSVFTKEYLERMEEADISEVKEAINIIQQTPWRINKEVFRVLEAILEAGGDIAEVPSLRELPQTPNLPEGYTEEELKRHKKRKWETYKKEVTRRSVASRCLSHFKLAQNYLKYERIYFPYNMDFRGRVYPISSFSPQSDDVNKGLLEFADAPPCNTMDDIKMLMIHGANVAGVDKVSFKERQQWVLDHEEQILRSAADPLGYRWWAEQDDSSFQLLAFCFEWSRWKDYYATYKTAKGFACNIPVAFDGTCSGLQHYSALLRDSIGGTAVNLVPGEAPNDIYGVVAKGVIKLLEKDLEKGTGDEQTQYEDRSIMKFGTRSLAQQWLTYGVTRKVTKRSVMTLPYGSKEFGFKQQLLEDVIKPAQKEGRGDMFISPTQSAQYMAKKIWQVVQKVVVKAMEGMKYLQEVSRKVCGEGRIITWVTPMGLPIQQAYMVYSAEKIQPRLSNGCRKWIYTQTPTGNIDKHAQVNGIAPNFIHSLDASHLQLTVLNSRKGGIKHFALIHDSFGCPASQAATLFKTVRESFIQLYTQYNPLETFTQNLAMYLEYPEDLPDIPKKGNLDLNILRESLYMFA